MTDRTFYIRLPVEGAGAYYNTSSGTKITIPEDLEFEEARAYVVERITQHLDWMVPRVLNRLGIHKTSVAQNGKRVMEVLLDGSGTFQWLLDNCLPEEREALLAENDRLWTAENTAKLKRQNGMPRLFEGQWEATKKALCEGADLNDPDVKP
jgi:hypothetical protein